MDKTKFHGSILITVVLFIVFLSASIFFYRERMLFVDPCFVNFTILNTGELVITEHRYGAMITQIFPWIGGMLHLPLSVTLALYSASFYLFFTTVILLLIYRFRQYGLAILMAFYFTLFVSDVYFWPNNEVHQGIGWMFLFFGVMLSFKKEKPGIGFFVGAIITAFLAIFSHFIVFLPFAFLWIYFLLQKEHWRLSRIATIGFSVALMILFFVKYQLGVDGWYDGEKLKGVTDLSFASIVNSFSNGHAATFTKNILVNYWLIIPVTLLGLIILFREKKFDLLAVTVISLIGYFVLVCITFPDAYGRELLFYMESQWMSFAIVAAAPFVYHILPKLTAGNITVILLIIFSIRLAYIANSGLFFHNRYLALESLIDTAKEKGISKAVIIEDEKLSETFLMTWGLPVETLTLSTIKGYNPPVTVKNITSEELIPSSSDTFLSSFSKMNVNELNPFYFKVDTTKYRLLDL